MISPKSTVVRDTGHKWSLPILIIFLMMIWSVLFANTFTLPFFWDDLHLIRHYSLPELLSTLHGPADPDGIETPGLRPVATLVFDLQGTFFGEHMVLQRVFIIILMSGLLWAVGLLLRDVGLSYHHVIVVLVLFTSSRVFASLVLWTVMGYIILTYTFMVLAALFYLRWIKSDRGHQLALALTFAVLAAFSREEAYTLPVILPLIWWLSTPNRKDYRRPIAGALGILAIIVFHYILRTVFIAGAPQPGLHLSQFGDAVFAAWFPGGAVTRGLVDGALKLFWAGFLAFLAVVFIHFGDHRRREVVFSTSVLGLLLCTPALAVFRAFGIALPTLTFLTAIAIAVIDVQRGFSSGRYGQGPWRSAILCACLIGLAFGVVAGIRRSVYVAQSLDENAVGAVIWDGTMLFDMHKNPVTIPENRRQALAAHLNALGIHSRADVIQLIDQRNSGDLGNLKPPLFAEKYPYLSF
jgi:hypothetical protein